MNPYRTESGMENEPDTKPALGPDDVVADGAAIGVPPEEPVRMPRQERSGAAVTPPADTRRDAIRRRLWRMLRRLPEPGAEFLYQQIKGACRDIGGVDGEVCAPLRSGGLMQLDMRDAQQRHIYYCGFYEQRFTRLLSRYLGEGCVFVDIGASIGFYTVWAARQVGSTGRVYSFEPNALAFDRTAQNIALNDLKNVVPFCAALGEREARGSLLQYENDLAKSCLATPGDMEKHDKELVEVTVRTLDQCLAEWGPQLRIDVIKLDAEGAETAILRGALPLLTGESHPPPCLLVEVDDVLLRRLGSSEKELLGFLGGLGYQPCRVTASGALRPYRGERRGTYPGHHNLFFLPPGCSSEGDEGDGGGGCNCEGCCGSAFPAPSL